MKKLFFALLLFPVITSAQSSMNILLFYIYNDGTVEKKIVVE